MAIALDRRRDGALPILILAGWILACSNGGTPINYLSRAEIGADWPLTVEGGEIACVHDNNRPIATFKTSDGTTYALNGAAQQTGRFADVTRIRQIMTMSVSSTVDRLEESVRQRIFREIVQCQDAGRGDQACKDRAASGEGLTAQEVNQIAIEGVSRSWPPLDPTYMSLSPVLTRALALCR